MAEKLAITIGRQYGSGGREIGVRVGELLGFKVYDKELINMAAEKHGFDPDYLHRVDEKAANSLLYALYMGMTGQGARHFHMDAPINDRLFMAQADIIREIAKEESAIFVGRCADYVLREHPNHISFFIYADSEARASRIMKRREVSHEEALNLIAKTDKQRVNYYNFYTGRKWGRCENYHMSVDSSLLGVEGTAQMIARIAGIYLSESEQDRKL